MNNPSNPSSAELETRVNTLERATNISRFLGAVVLSVGVGLTAASIHDGNTTERAAGAAGDAFGVIMLMRSSDYSRRRNLYEAELMRRETVSVDPADINLDR